MKLSKTILNLAIYSAMTKDNGIIPKWMQRLIKIGVKKRYWYQVEFIYSKNNICIFRWYSQVGILNNCKIQNIRGIKKSQTPLHHVNKTKEYLCNGILDVKIVSYLGRFKQT